MGLARGLERRLEQLVDGFAAKLFRGRIHPVELGTRIVREADLAVYETPVGPGAPNAFDVTLGGDPEPPETVAGAERELAAVMEAAASERGWRLEGPVTIRIQFGSGPASRADVTASVEVGPAPAWARLTSTGSNPVDVSINRSVIGRSSSADVHLGNDDVSRNHALIWREGGAIWLADLESSNGTQLNGERITDVVDLLDGDVITLGATKFTLQVL
jgi:hypothetical protein